MGEKGKSKEEGNEGEERMGNGEEGVKKTNESIGVTFFP